MENSKINTAAFCTTFSIAEAKPRRYNVSYNVINHGECVGGPGAYGAYDYAHGAKEEYAVRYGMLLVALVPTPEPTPVAESARACGYYSG